MKSTPKKDQKVTVKSFEATVTRISNNACVKVKDDDGYYHWVYRSQLTVKPPYLDGFMYIDANDVLYTFIANHNGKPMWSRTSMRWHYDYPSRPLRVVGEVIEE